MDLPDELWNKMWQIHSMAHVWAARAVVPEMVERGEGYFMVTASAAGLLTIVETAAYAVTKHAAVAFAEWLRIAYGRKGVRVRAHRASFNYDNQAGDGLQTGISTTSIVNNTISGTDGNGILMVGRGTSGMGMPWARPGSSFWKEADSTKMGTRSFVSAGTLNRVHTIVTDTGIDERLVRSLTRRGIRVIAA